ncbi:MAG TPA: ParB N-terminal domain-containing protein [Planctomicrobium sp.]|nr:ParB N-terminal domain-containing protein [Planctomicrobium sp.]
MQLKTLPVSLLRPAPYNPRLTLKPGDPAWVKLERSLTEFELVQPIVWNQRTGHVVSGHQRLSVLKYHGKTEVDCVVVDLPLEKEKALNVTLNNSTVGSDWDPDRLIDLVAELQDLPDFDATLTGFDEQQLKDLLLTPAPATDEPDSDADTQSSHRQVTLEVPDSCWEEVQADLNTLLAQFPEVRLHVRNS